MRLFKHPVLKVHFSFSCGNLNSLITSDTFLPMEGKDKDSPKSEIRFHLFCCTVLSKSVFPIGNKNLVKIFMR
jgi:hypothetical protein